MTQVLKPRFQCPGAFVGTPDFASPEQLAGVQVDIRSDLYSLGATLWKMLTGQAPFRGTCAEMMHQHLHAPLAIGQLNHAPQPVVVLIEILLEKDPGRRFHNPAEVLKAILTTTGAINARRRITRQSLQNMPPAADAYNGDIRYREEVSKRLADDVRQGVHARKVMDSYQTWFGEGPELSVLRILGLFDRTAEEKALGRNAMVGSIIIIERLRPSCQAAFGRWSRFSWL